MNAASAYLRKHYRIIIFLCLIAIIICRAPNLFIQPRFWAEEGSGTFNQAYYNPWYKTIFKAYHGYIPFLPNAASILATLVPLRYAPFVTSYIYFLIQLIPYIIILWGNTLPWNSPLKKILCSLIVLFSPSATGEIWLAQSPSHLTLITFLILLESAGNNSKLKTNFKFALLVIAGLTSPASLFLIPIYIITYLREKEPVRLKQTIALGICLVIQMIALFYCMSNHATGGRFSDFSSQESLRNFIGLCLFGPLLGFKLKSIQEINNFLPLIIAWSVSVFILVIYVARENLIPRRMNVQLTKNSELFGLNRATLKTIVASFIVFLFSMIFSVKVRGGFRYAYAPNVMLVFFFIYLTFYANKKFIKNLSIILIAASLISGIAQYKSSMREFNYYRQWPKWADEVSAWKKDHNKPLRVWPQEIDGKWIGHNWQIILKDKNTD